MTTRGCMSFAYGAVTHCGPSFQDSSAIHRLCNSVEDLMLLPSRPTTPNRQRHQALPPDRFRLLPFRSPLLRESLLLSFPRGTEMFQFPRCPPPGLCVRPGVTRYYAGRVAPFGDPRFSSLDSSPGLFAVLPRPSSALDAKASTVRP